MHVREAGTEDGRRGEEGDVSHCPETLTKALTWLLSLPPLPQLKELGEESQAAAFHGIRLGMTLAGGLAACLRAWGRGVLACGSCTAA